MNDPDFRLEVRGYDIVWKLPGTTWTLSYRKLPNVPDLVMAYSWLPLATTPAVTKFQTRAFQAAVDKARELGWIV